MKQITFTSIKFKIISMMLIVTALIIAIGFTFVIISNVKKMRTTMLNNTKMHTKLIGEYCVSPLIFDDVRGAEEVLSRLATVPTIICANVYDSQNKFYASFQRDTLTLSYPDFKRGAYHEFSSNFLYTCEPIIYKGQKYGTVYILASTQLLEDEITGHLNTMIILILFLFFIAVILAQWFQKIISSPIINLVKVMELVSQKKDYSIRITNKATDEIEILYQGFNSMLEQIQKQEIERDNDQKKLESAKEKAEESDKLKSAFLANMSHEIRTPMNAIIGFSELLADPNIGQNKKLDYIKYINRSSNTLLTLVNDIIDISKLEASQLTINKTECNVNNILTEQFRTFEEIKLPYFESQVEIRLILPPEIIKIDCDLVRLKQIITNLMSNALKFTENGFVELGAYVETDWVTLYVKDTGIGIEKNQLDVIFDRFRKAALNDNEKLYRGAGLGLAITKSLVTMLNGKIKVESQPGKGSVFFVSFPKKSATNISETIPKSIKKDAVIYNWSGKIILIAEDEEINYRYFEAILRKTGVQLLWASDGALAVEMALKNNNISLILMDIKMPKLNGYEAVRQIKKVKNIPIISQTAYAMESERKQSIDAGCDDYISKPIHVTSLMKMIDKYLCV